jgi:hypothetical protein
MIGKHSLTIGK